LGGSAPGQRRRHHQRDLPLGNADVTINGLDYLPGVSNVTVDNSFQLLTNEEGDDGDGRADDRFPYHIPRPSRYCGEWFTAVQFDLASPAGTFGVFLPAATNIHSTQNPPDDHNFVKMTQSVHVLIQGEGDSLAEAQHEYVSLFLGNGSYCPFLMVEWNGNTPIAAVSVIHDCYVDHSPTFGFMDVYAAAPPAATPGDANYDGWIDGKDYTLWADNYEPGVGGKTWGQGDFSGDGIVDGADYTRRLQRRRDRRRRRLHPMGGILHRCSRRPGPAGPASRAGSAGAAGGGDGRAPPPQARLTPFRTA